MQLFSFLSIILVVPAAIAAPAELRARSDAQFEAGLSKQDVAMLRKLNSNCYMQCVNNCRSFMQAGPIQLQRCLSVNCAPMVQHGRCLRSRRHGTRDLHAELEAQAEVGVAAEADVDAGAEAEADINADSAASLRARSDPQFEAGLSKQDVAMLRKLNSNCYKQCVNNCRSFIQAGPIQLQRCLSVNCAPMVQHGRCLRNHRNGTRDLRAESESEAEADIDAE